MQINTGTSQTKATNSRPRSEAVSSLGTVIRADVQDDAIVLQVAGKTVSIPWQSGFSAGDQVLFRLNENMSFELQKVPTRAIPNNAVAGNALDSLAKVLSLQASDLGAFLELAERTLDDQNSVQADAKALLRSVLPQLSTSQLSTLELTRLTSPLFEYLQQSSDAKVQNLGSALQKILASQYPGIDLVHPLIQQAQDLLGTLASNDFKASAPLIQSMAEQVSEQRSNPATSTPQARDLQAWARLSEPLQELVAWGAPSEIFPDDLQTLQRYASQVVSLPLSADAKAVASFEALPSQFNARIVATSERALILDIQASKPESATNETSAIRLTFEIPEGHPWATLFRAGNTQAFEKLALPINSAAHAPRIIPAPNSAFIPPQELSTFQANNVPLSANLVDAQAFLREYGNLKISPQQVAAFAQTLHQLDLQLPHGETLQPEQKDLAFRWMLSTQRPESLQGLARYQSELDPEGTLFEQLPETQKKWLGQELEKHGFKPLQPKELLQLLDKMPPLTPQNSTPAERDLTQNLQRQLQWTQFDQDTRPSEDRQQVFYFYQSGELHKGRLQVKHQKSAHKGSAGADDTQRFFVETRTGQLGKVHVDFQIRNGVVALDFADAQGQAQKAVEQERPELASELASIGLTLSQLAYHVFQESRDTSGTDRLSQTSQNPHNKLLDLRA